MPNPQYGRSECSKVGIWIFYTSETGPNSTRVRESRTPSVNNILSSLSKFARRELVGVTLGDLSRSSVALRLCRTRIGGALLAPQCSEVGRSDQHRAIVLQRRI